MSKIIIFILFIFKMSSESIASYTTLVLLLFLIFVILVAGLWLYNQYNLLIAIYYNDLASVQQNIEQIKEILNGLRPRPPS